MPLPDNNLLQQLTSILDFLTDAERVHLLSELKARYCVFCGRHQPVNGYRCQCWNDS